VVFREETFFQKPVTALTATTVAATETATKDMPMVLQYHDEVEQTLLYNSEIYEKDSSGKTVDYVTMQITKRVANVKDGVADITMDLLTDDAGEKESIQATWKREPTGAIRDYRIAKNNADRHPSDLESMDFMGKLALIHSLEFPKEPVQISDIWSITWQDLSMDKVKLRLTTKYQLVAIKDSVAQIHAESKIQLLDSSEQNTDIELKAKAQLRFDLKRQQLIYNKAQFSFGPNSLFEITLKLDE